MAQAREKRDTPGPPQDAALRRYYHTEKSRGSTSSMRDTFHQVMAKLAFHCREAGLAAVQAGEIYQDDNRADVAAGVSVGESFDQLLAPPAAPPARMGPNELIELTRDPDRGAAVKTLKSALTGSPEFAPAFAALDRGGPLEFLLVVQELAYKKKSEGAASSK